MQPSNKRKHVRIDSTNLVSYVCQDAQHLVVKAGMGRTLNVSEGGILLETHQPVDAHSQVALTIALEDEVVVIQGRVAYSKQRGDGRYETGVEFVEGDARKVSLLRQSLTLLRAEAQRQT
jgi:hypothetical protein